MTHSPAPSYRQILFQNWHTQAYIGCHPHEKLQPQRIVLNLSIDVKDVTITHDLLAEVANYEWFYERISQLLKTERFQLQETLAQALCDLCLSHAAVAQVEVTTAKPEAFPDVVVACRLRRQKNTDSAPAGAPSL